MSLNKSGGWRCVCLMQERFNWFLWMMTNSRGDWWMMVVDGAGGSWMVTNH